MQTATIESDSNSIATDAADRLIASDKMESTAVYSRQGEYVGSVCTIMVDKRSGQAAYAVVSSSDFLGLGDSCYPVPWKALNYDAGLGGYVVDLDKDRLEGAPSYTSGEAPNWSDPAYACRIDEYYGYDV